MSDEERSREVATRQDAPVGMTLYDGTPFIALTRSIEEIREIYEANIDSDSITEFDLVRVNVPGGGGLMWSVPDLGDEPLAVKELEGVVLFKGNRRAYWEKAFDESGGGNPPDCSSLDGKTGRGFIPGDDRSKPPVTRECDKCPMSRWGSFNDDPEDNRPACSRRKLVFMLRQGDMIPLAIDLAPTSVKPFNDFMIRVTSRFIPSYGAVVGLKLINEHSRTGIKYSVISPRLLPNGLLSDEQKQKVKWLRSQIEPIFHATGVAAAPPDVVEAADDAPSEDDVSSE